MRHLRHGMTMAVFLVAGLIIGAVIGQHITMALAVKAHAQTKQAQAGWEQCLGSLETATAGWRKTMSQLEWILNRVQEQPR